MKNAGKTIKTVLITFILTLLIVALLGFYLFTTLDFPYRNLLNIISIIETSYVDEYDRKASEEKAINAVLEGLGDRYAAYYDKENLNDIVTLIEGHYTGIGAEVFANNEKNRIEIISAYEDSPAANAGIISGDMIKSIDGKEYKAADLADAVLYLKGAGVKDPLNTPVDMTMIRGESEYSITLNRAEVNLYKVKSEIIDDICYIRYSGFTEDSYKDFKKTIDDIDESVKGIVVDMRGNLGGEFNSALAMCDIFLDDEMIMYTLDKNGDKEVYSAKKGSCKLPLAILVNAESASATEVFAGAIKANKRGIIVGEKTFGKGVSQSVIYLDKFEASEGALKLTTYKNYTPDGIWINEGIAPDILVSVPINEDISKDEAFLAAVKSLKEDK